MAFQNKEVRLKTGSETELLHDAYKTLNCQYMTMKTLKCVLFDKSFILIEWILIFIKQIVNNYFMIK